MNYSDEQKEEILKKYKLPDQKHEELYQMIKRIWTDDQYPVDNPIAVIIGGQTGAGKSGIISYSQKMFKDGNVVVINSDEIKPFHPDSVEIAREYPELYTKITDQDSNTWTSQLFGDVRKEGYNLIFEGTMKNNRVADEAIVELKKLGYTVVVRGLAVSDLESRLSIHERYEAQVEKKGWGRLVVPEHHNQTYNGMPNTIEYIENNSRYDILEIYKRSDLPDSPELIYTKHNPHTIDKIQKSVNEKKFISKHSSRYGYNNAKEAILEGRKEDLERVMPTCDERFKNIMKTMKLRQKNNAPDAKEEYDQFLELMKYYERKKKLKNQMNNL